jgi:hypothetical protein
VPYFLEFAITIMRAWYSVSSLLQDIVAEKNRYRY